MTYIENAYLKVGVADHGAELSTVYDKEKQQEVIWQAHPAFRVPVQEGQKKEDFILCFPGKRKPIPIPSRSDKRRSPADAEDRFRNSGTM